MQAVIGPIYHSEFCCVEYNSSLWLFPSPIVAPLLVFDADASRIIISQYWLGIITRGQSLGLRRGNWLFGHRLGEHGEGVLPVRQVSNGVGGDQVTSPGRGEFQGWGFRKWDTHR